MVVAAIIILLVTIYLKVAYDFKLWQRHLPVNHAKEIAIVTIPVGVSVFLFGYQSNYFISIFLCGSWYLFLFNGLYNVARRFYWFFIGTHDDNDSFTERFFRAIGMPATIILQILLPVVSTILYIIYFKRS